MPGRNEPNVSEINYEYLLKFVDELKYDGCIGRKYRPALTTTAGLG